MLFLKFLFLKQSFSIYKHNKEKKLEKQIKSVEEFHRIYKLGNSKKPIAKLENQKENLRFELMKEENEEYIEAAKNGDIVEVADALGDMMYILCGTIIEHGMQHIIEEVFDEIHKSNLSKLDENGNPIYREDGKVIKGPNYFPPDIKKIMKKYL